MIVDFSKSLFHEFVTLAETEAYMRNNEVEHYNRDVKHEAETTTSKKEKTAYYAIAYGHKSEIREYYQ